MAQTKGTTSIIIPAVNFQEFDLPLVGDSPLIVNNWSKKAIEMMLAKQMKKAKTGKQAKNPQEDFEASMYRLEDGGHGFPAGGFKATAINACRQVDGLAMTEAKGAFQVLGDLIRLECSEPVMREDMVRIGPGISDIRYRAMYEKWSVIIRIKHNADFMSEAQIINLFNIAGFCSGVGEWRPSSPKCSGPFGMFHVKTGEE